MNGHMKVSRPTLRLLLGMLALSLLSGCSSDGSSSSGAQNELKTINLYTSEGEIFSFNAKSGTTKTIANYDSHEHALVTLNTDNDVDGFEQFVYIDDQTIYTLATDKINPVELATVDASVCIFSISKPDQTSFTGTTQGERILVDQHSIYITPLLAGVCDNSSARIKRIDFTDTKKVIIQEVSAALLWGEKLLDYDYNPRNDDTVTDEKDTDLGRFGTLGSNFINTSTPSILQLSFYDEDNTLLWSKSFSDIDTLPTIDQVTEDEVLIQIGGNLYLPTIESLFSATTVDNGEVPTNSKIDKLFEAPLHTLSNTNISDLKTTNNGSSFALVDDGEVLFYDTSTNNFTSLDVKDVTANSIAIKMIDNGTLLLHRNLTGSETLSSINTTTKIASTIPGTNKDNGDENGDNKENDTKTKIDFYTEGNDIYINTHALGGAKAIWINSSFAETSFPNTLFAFSNNYRKANAEPEIFLISSSDIDSSIDGFLTNAHLFKFAPSNRATGRKRFKNSDSVSEDFIVGTFNSDIEIRELSNSEIFNDVYGKLVLKTTRNASEATDTYFFNPTEQDSFESGNANKALQLIETTE